MFWSILEMALTGFIVLILTIVFLFVKRILQKKPLNFPPGYKGVPILGVLPYLGTNPSLKFIEWGKKFGPVFSVRMGSADMVVLNDFDSIIEFLSKKGKYTSDRPDMPMFNDVRRGKGLSFHRYNDQYKSNIKLATLSLKKFGGSTEDLEVKVAEEMEFLSEAILAFKGKPFDIKQTISNAVCSIICNVIFGQRLGYENKQVLDLMEGMNKLFNNKDDSVYINLLMMNNGLRHIPPFSGVRTRFHNTYKKRTNILKDIIKQHRQTWDNNVVRDVIDLFFLQQEKENNPNYEAELPFVLTDLFDGGVETTSTTLRWCIMYLARHRQTQVDLVRETEEAIGEKQPLYDDRNSMPLMCSFIDEIMRHRTLLPLSVIRRTSDEVKLYQYTIPKDTEIIPNLWAVHYDPKIFKNPEKIIPERFINKATGIYEKSPNVIPFGAGIRKCPGYQLAEKELFLMLTSILQRFEIKEDENHPLPDMNDGINGFVYFHKDFKVSIVPRK